MEVAAVDTQGQSFNLLATHSHTASPRSLFTFDHSPKVNNGQEDEHQGLRCGQSCNIGADPLGQPPAESVAPPQTEPYEATTHIATGVLAVDNYLNNHGEETPAGIVFDQEDLDNAVKHGYTVYRMELDPYDDWLSFEQFAAMYYGCAE